MKTWDEFEIGKQYVCPKCDVRPWTIVGTLSDLAKMVVDFGVFAIIAIILIGVVG